MFMTEIPENAEGNVHLQALQALKYEGKPDDVALDLMVNKKIYINSQNQKKV